MWLLAILPVARRRVGGDAHGDTGSAWRRVVDAHLLRHLLLTDAGPARHLAVRSARSPESRRASRWPARPEDPAADVQRTSASRPWWSTCRRRCKATISRRRVSAAPSSCTISPSAAGRPGRARALHRRAVCRSTAHRRRTPHRADESRRSSGLMPLRRARPALVRRRRAARSGERRRRARAARDVGSRRARRRTIAAARELASSGHLSVLGAGPGRRAPSRDARGRIEKDASGAVLAKLDRAALESLARGGGRFSEIRADDTDLADRRAVASGGQHARCQRGLERAVRRLARRGASGG